ncbi:FK506-binding protein 15 isoform X1 [Astyanax mexicanus]|uniref:FK506-binding protein 15 isoform X1 n=1 Tax=Astyanax mexicanus TaxID=7994 RepID=UPI0020CAFE3B|nr:FK506-binding protein 15 isoform X1 [Astyanax mexicanus]
MKEVTEIFTDYLDEEFLAPKSGAKLASLFGLHQAESQGNESFQFTAPKQPKKPSATAGPPPSAPAVLFATGVHAFCYVNGQYVKQGKLGAAILGNHVTKEYKILLYGSQQKHITTARIHPGFILTVQSGNYITFYDDQRQNWSLKFDPEKAGLDFCKEVCLAKFNSRTCVDGLVVQDLLQGEGMAVDVGDTVEVAFSGWLLQNHAVGQMFDSNIGKNKLQRVRLGSGKVLKGWEDGMVGMRKRGRRLLIIPPGMGHGLKGVPSHVPSTSTLVYDVEIHQVKFSKDEDCFSSGSADSATASPVPLDSSALESTDQSAVSVSPDQRDQDQAPHGKSGALNELPKNSDEAKAKLISRMAKMGQPMLPFLKGAIPVQPEQEKNVGESDPVCDPFPQEISRSSSPQPVQVASKPSPCSVSPKPVAIQQPETNTTGFPQQVDVSSGRAFQPYTASQLHPFASVFPSQYQTAYQAVDISSFLLTETRQHNTEVRLAVGKVADRLDQLASKVENLQKQGFCAFGMSSISLEPAMILNNIQRIVQENSSLKKEVLERDCKVEEQTRKIGELIEQRQRYMEQSNLLMEQSNSTQQTCSQQNNTRLVLLKTEHEKVCLSEELSSSSSSEVCELQDKAVQLQQRATELQSQLDTALQEGQHHCSLISSLQTQVEELKNERDQSQQEWRAEKQKSRKMELTLKTMEEDIHDLRTEKEILEQTLSDRKRRWQLERERLLMEQEEQRRSSEEENQQLREQLRRARASADAHARQQAELDLEWQERCDVSVKTQTVKLEAVVNQLKEQCAALQKKQESDGQLLETQLAVQIKQVMNRLYHSLRAQFALQGSYTGDSVLKMILKTIKHVTMRLLKHHQELDPAADSEAGDEEERYFSAEDTGKEENVEESGIKCEKEDFQESLDQTYMTAQETTHLESSKLISDSSSSIALVVEGQPVDTEWRDEHGD